MHSQLIRIILLIICSIGIHPLKSACEELFQYRLRQILMEPTLSPEHKEDIRLKAESCRAQAESGQDFTELAKKRSEEPGADRTGGDLGYFTHEQMVKPFSDVVFAMSPGEIAGPVETQYGYHIIKLHDIDGDRRHAQHILFSFTPDAADSAKVRETLQSIRDRYRAGESFDTLFDEYNTNDFLADTKGYMVWQTNEELLPSFQENVTGLKPGQVSEPFSSIVGLHIVLVDSINYDHDHILEGFPSGIPVK